MVKEVGAVLARNRNLWKNEIPFLCVKHAAKKEKDDDDDDDLLILCWIERSFEKKEVHTIFLSSMTRVSIYAHSSS